MILTPIYVTTSNRSNSSRKIGLDVGKGGLRGDSLDSKKGKGGLLFTFQIIRFKKRFITDVPTSLPVFLS